MLFQTINGLMLVSMFAADKGTAIANPKSAKSPKSGNGKSAPMVEPLTVGYRGNVQWFNLHAFEERNSRADSWGDVFSDLDDQTRPLRDGETDADRRTTADGLIAKLLNGWDELQQAYVEVTLPTAADVELAIKQRRQRIEAWRNDRDENMGAVANFAEQFWFPHGDPAPILGVINLSYRRMRAMPAVVWARKQRGIDASGQFPIPVLVREYADSLAAYMRHVDENLGKDAGRKDYTPLDYLRIAADIHRLGGNEAALRKYGNVGESQRAFRFVKLATRYPDLHLIERANLKPPALDPVTGKLPYSPPSAEETGCYFPYRSIDKEDLQALLTDKQPGHKPLKTAPDEILTAETLEDYIEGLVSGGKRAISWNRKDSEAMQSHKSEVFRALGWAMSNGKREAVKDMEVFAAAIDKAAREAGFSLDDFKRKYGTKAK